MRIGESNIDIYLDGADIDTMLRLADRIDGATTNPSLARKAGVSDYRKFCCVAAEALNPKPISLEILSEDPPEILRQARLLHELNTNVYVKVPVVRSGGESNIDLIQSLSASGCKVNATAVFRHRQVHDLFDAFSKSSYPAIVSVFAGRIADTGLDPQPMLKACTAYKPSNVRLLWASSREPYNVIQAAECGCDIITLFSSMIDKIDTLFGKDLLDFSRETSAMFARDAREAGYTL